MKGTESQATAVPRADCQGATSPHPQQAWSTLLKELTATDQWQGCAVGVRDMACTPQACHKVLVECAKSCATSLSRSPCPCNREGLNNQQQSQHKCKCGTAHGSCNVHSCWWTSNSMPCHIQLGRKLLRLGSRKKKMQPVRLIRRGCSS